MNENPKRPPRGWWRRCVAGVKESDSAYDPASVCGSLWYRKMSSKQRREAARKYERNPMNWSQFGGVR